ncbi:hypothetical protein D3C76_998530 [compost metagenome]
MIDSYNVGSTGRLEACEFGCTFLHVFVGGLQNFFHVDIGADIRLAPHGRLQIAVMAMTHAACGKRDGVFGRRLGGVELQRLPDSDNQRRFGHPVSLKIVVPWKIPHLVMRGRIANFNVHIREFLKQLFAQRIF